MGTITQGTRYTGPSVSSTRVVSGSSVTVKSSGQTLSSGGTSARSPTPQTTTSSSQPTSTTTTTSQPTTNRTVTNLFSPTLYSSSGTAIPLSGTSAGQQMSIAAPTGTVTTSTTPTQASSISSQPTSSAYTSSGTKTTAKLPSSFTQPTLVSTDGKTQITSTSGTQSTQTYTPPPKTETKTLTTTPDAYKRISFSILPSVTASTQADIEAQAGLKKPLPPQLYQTYKVTDYMQQPGTQSSPLDEFKPKYTKPEERTSQFTPEGMISLGTKKTISQKIAAPFIRIGSGIKTVFTSPGDVGKYQYDPKMGYETFGATIGIVGTIASTQLIGPTVKAYSAVSTAIKSTGTLGKLSLTYLKAKVSYEIANPAIKELGRSTYISSPEQKYFVQSPQFKEAYAGAYAAQESSGKTAGIFYGVARPIAIFAEEGNMVAFSGKGAFIEKFREIQTAQGYSRQEVDRNVALALQERKTGAAAEAVAFIASSATIEYSGRELFASSAQRLASFTGTKSQVIGKLAFEAAKNLFPLGAIEGAVQTAAAAKIEGRTAGAKEVAVGGAFGAVSATVIGVPIAIKGMTKGVVKGAIRGLEFTANVADYSEKLGDITADLFTSARYRVTGTKTPAPAIFSVRPKVYSFTVTTTPQSKTTPLVFTDSGVSTRTTTSSLTSTKKATGSGGKTSPFTGTLTPTKTLIPSITTTPTSTKTPTASLTSSRTKSSIFVPTPVPTPVPSQTSLPTGTTTPVPTPVQTPVSLPTGTTTPVPTPVPTPVGTQTSIPVNVFTPQNFGFPLNIGAGWGGKGTGGSGGKGRGYAYAPSLKALYLGIRGKATVTGGYGFSGLELRPIVGASPRRVERRVDPFGFISNKFGRATSVRKSVKKKRRR